VGPSVVTPSMVHLTKGYQEKLLPGVGGGKCCIVVQLITRLRLRGSPGKTPPNSRGEKWCIDSTSVPTFESFTTEEKTPPSNGGERWCIDSDPVSTFGPFLTEKNPFQRWRGKMVYRLDPCADLRSYSSSSTVSVSGGPSGKTPPNGIGEKWRLRIGNPRSGS
jgi:hypothetical protein